MMELFLFPKLYVLNLCKYLQLQCVQTVCVCTLRTFCEEVTDLSGWQEVIGSSPEL